MPTQSQQPTFPTDPFPAHPSTPPAADPLTITQTLGLVHHFGMFCLPPVPQRHGLLSHSVYAEPCLDAAYPEGFIYWRETFRLFDDAPPLSLGVNDFNTGKDLVAEMVRLDGPSLRGWRVFRSHE